MDAPSYAPAAYAGVHKIETAWITLPDGCRLAATLWMPEKAGPAHKVPAILEYLPYRRRDGTVLRDEATHRWFAANGYAALRVDMRGCGDSDGLFADEYLPQEQEDGAAVIAWIARQDWCTGAVGLMGISWGGFNALQIAARRPPALKAIVSVCSTDDRYADDTHYMGGGLLTGNVTWAAVMLATCARPPDPDVVGERWRAMWHERLAHIPILAATWLAHQRRDAYWQQGSVCEDFAAITCPVLAVGGWTDAYTNAVPRLLAGLSAPKRGLIGPWAHRYPQDGVPGPAIGFLQECKRWWDRWLTAPQSDRANDIMAEPLLRSWLMHSPPEAGLLDPAPGAWAAETAWPSPNVVTRSLHLAPATLAHTPGAGSVEIATPETLGLAGGAWCPYGYEGDVPPDQAPDDAISACFDSADLSAPLTILGFPVLTVRVAADRPVASLVARLNDVAPDGTSVRVSYGVLNLTHRDSHAEPTPLVPGRVYSVRFALNAAGHVFAPGRRIRLALSTSYWPTLWPSPERATLTLDCAGSALDLPVRVAAREDDARVAFAPPQAAPGAPHTALREADRPRSITRQDGWLVIRAAKDRGAFRIDTHGMEVDSGGVETFRIRDGDPLSASLSSEWSITQRRGAWRVRTATRTAFRATANAFLLDAFVDAWEGPATNETQVFTLARSFAIKRDLA
jgi:putative CocE/NonD family hydrolase